jgi:acetylornithine deacetylase/succinyl-diaminopimelate desuccinylase-like protein
VGRIAAAILYPTRRPFSSKTVLSAKAGAKFSFRLVPNQDPARVASALRAFLTPLWLPGIHRELIERHGGPGVAVPWDSPYLQAAVRAIECGFGRAPVFPREGRSIPIVTAFR